MMTMMKRKRKQSKSFLYTSRGSLYFIDSVYFAYYMWFSKDKGKAPEKIKLEVGPVEKEDQA